MLLSIVASWADGCQRMDQDAYADPEVAALIGRGLVAVRVDSDERPDVNERYNLGGWPTTAVLTPDGDLLAGGTFFGREDLLRLLQRTLEAFAGRGAEIRALSAARARDRLRRSHHPPPDHESPTTPHSPPTHHQPDWQAVAWLRAHLLSRLDRECGGFVAERGSGEAGAAKFPHAAALRFLLRLYRSEARASSHTGAHASSHTGAALDEALIRTLDALAAGGLRDPATGAFFRYAEGPDWSAPRRELTVGDNAALLMLFGEAADVFGDERYRRVARGTLGYLIERLSGTVTTDAAASAIAACLTIPVDVTGGERQFLLDRLDDLVQDAYHPGRGVIHMPVPVGPSSSRSTAPDRIRSGDAEPAAAFLVDQVAAADAALAAHGITGSPVYSMLAEELMRTALRILWDEEVAAFADRAGRPDDVGLLREPIHPLQANCEAAVVLLRLAREPERECAADLEQPARRILETFAGRYRDDGILGAPYGLAMLEFTEFEATRR